MLLVPLPPRVSAPTLSRRLGRHALAVIATAAVHAIFVALIVVSSLLKWDVKDRPRARTATNRPVTLRGLTTEQFEKNRGPSAPALKDERKVIAKKPELPKEEKKPDEMPKGQVVDVAPGNNQVDDKAKYLAETNNAVKKETRAKEQTAFYRNAMPQRTAPQKVEGNGSSETKAPQVSGNDGIGDDDRPLKEAAPKLAMEVPDVQKRQEISIKSSDDKGPGLAVSNRDETQEMKGNSQRLKLTPGTPGDGEDASAGRVGKAGVLNLLPSSAVVDKITGAAANDFLKDVDEGDGTYLSTREWRYASFFNRVKQSVGQNWQPTESLRLRDPTGQIYGGRDRYTILNVTLDGSGRLKDAFVDKSSGLDFLDLEAIKAFERAQPFPNPPPGLLANDQTVRFQFGFFLELSGRPGMRLFRSTQ
ncbi:MAG: cell envelope integrity protein TolA [Myxococcaceae bacterium]